MNSRHDMVIKTGFGLALLILVGLGVRSYQNTRALIGNTSQMDHAFRVSVALDELVIHVVASEHTLRAALLADDESLLAAYHKNADLSGRSMQDLERLFAGEAGQRLHVGELRAQVEGILAFQGEQIRAWQSQGREAALRMFGSRNDARLLAEIRERSGELMAAENRLLQQRTQAARQEAITSLGTLLAGALLSFAILILVYYGLTRQIAMRQRSEQRLVHLNRLYAVLIHVNEIIGRASQREALFREICRVTVEKGLFRIAWVGLVNPDTHMMEPVAHWGPEDGYLGMLRIFVDDRPEGRGPTGTAFREGKPSVCEDIRTDPRMGPWREEALKRGLLSSAAFPIHLRRGLIGTFTAYASQTGFFDTETVDLLRGVTSDLALALESIEQEEERSQAVDQIRRLNEDLERRIQARTAELSASNHALELRNREIQRANRLKTEFLARMSHELRTPMNAIIGFSDLLVEETHGPLHPTDKRFVAHIREGAGHLLAIINDVLDISKIEAGRIELSCEDFDAGDALSEVLSVIRPLAEVKRIRLDSRVAEGVSVFADRRRFKQIVYNLVSNAVKFTPEGGDVWIEAQGRDSRLSFMVGDTGVGIPPEEHGSVFDEFHQAGATTKGVKEGTGLGLSITRRLVELHGGSISVESAPGKGSLFTFCLPAQRAHVTGATA